MEDDLNILETGRQPHFFLKMKDDLKFLWKLNTTSIFFENERRPQFCLNGRRPPFFFKWKVTSFFFENWRQPQKNKNKVFYTKLLSWIIDAWLIHILLNISLSVNRELFALFEILFKLAFSSGLWPDLDLVPTGGYLATLSLLTRFTCQ